MAHTSVALEKPSDFEENILFKLALCRGESRFAPRARYQPHDYPTRRTRSRRSRCVDPSLRAEKEFPGARLICQF